MQYTHPMDKKYIGIALGVALVVVLSVGAWFTIRVPVPGDSGMSQTAPGSTTEGVASDSISYPHDDPASPYIDLDPKLHIAREITLDPEIITINYELKDVALCGETYKTKQVIIDGVDVVQRYSAIMIDEKEKRDWFCEMLVSGTRNAGGSITPEEEIHITIGREEEGYTISISLGAGLIDVRSGTPHSWLGGMGGVVSPERNAIITRGGVFGTLR
jgi:hypothetical protein